MLLGTPGLALWATLAGGGVRGCIRINDNLAIVSVGGNFYRVAANATFALIGTVPNGSSPMSMAYNGTVVMAVCGADGYFIDPVANTVTQIVDENFAGADRVDFVDGYFVWNKPDTGQFQISGLYSTGIDGLDFATAEGGPDNLVSVIVDHREIWLLGENTTEVWINVGDVDFPFQRIQGAFLEIGCAAVNSVAKLDNSIFWLAIDDRGFGTVQRAVGYAPQRVSNHSFEAAVARYRKGGTIADAVAYTYAQEGHAFYVITFPTANATWAYDASTNLWHERAYLNPATGSLDRHRSNCQMQFAGMTIAGDWQTAKLYRMDLDVYTDDGATLPMIRVCPHITNDTKYVIFNALELTMQTGVGLTTGQGSDPQAMLKWSDDGGYAWSNELWASIGAIGQRKSRVRWRRLGKSRDRIFMVTISDPVKRVITGASLETMGCLV